MDEALTVGVGYSSSSSGSTWTPPPRTKQSDIFLLKEGNAWWNRNKDKERDFDRVLGAIATLELHPTSVLEIGCANGARLKQLKKLYQCAVCGVDPSTEAMRIWLRQKDARGIVGVATSLPGGKDKFDLVIFGFCLYVCDREDLFKIVMESDRVLQDQGYLVIHDFFSEAAHSRRYSHHDGLRSFKMDHAKLWLANPAYTLVDQCVYDAGPDSIFTGEDNRIVVSVLKKDVSSAFPLKE